METESSMVTLRQNSEEGQIEDQPNKPALWRVQTGIRAGDDIFEGLTTILEASTEIGDSLIGAR